MMQVQIQIGKKTIPLPTSWETAGRHAWPCLKYIIREGEDAGKLKAIQKLCGFSRAQMRGLNSVQIATLAQGLSWLQVSPVAKPILQQFYYRGHYYEFPSAKMEDGTAIEFAMADDFFSEYHDGNDLALFNLLGTLARPTKGGKRIPIHSRDEAIKRGDLFQKIPAEILVAAWMYWAGIKEAVHDMYGDWLFKTPEKPNPSDDEDDTNDLPDTDAAAGPNFKWWGVYMDIAESGVFGDIRAVHQSNFHELCIFLVKKEAERRKMQSEIKSIKHKR